MMLSVSVKSKSKEAEALQGRNYIDAAAFAARKFLFPHFTW